MPDQDAPSARERQLARELRVLRGTVGLQGKDVALRLGWSASKLSRIENSRIGITPEDLEHLIELYEVPARRASYLRKLAPSTRARGWWDAYAETLSSGYTSLLKLEAGSSALMAYCAIVPHALLLTPAYARRIILATPQRPSLAEVDRRIDIVRRRQELLSQKDGREPLRLSVVIDEAVLRRHILDDAGDADEPGTLRQQLQHLVDAAARPSTTIQVLRFTSGLPPVSAGAFSLLESFASQAPDVVYLENKSRIFFIESEEEVHGYARDFELLRTMALSPADSLDYIGQTISRLA